MLNKCFALTAVLLMGTVANAQSEVNAAGLPVNSDMQSEFFFQAPAGHSDLSLRLGYEMLTSKSETPGSVEGKRNGLFSSGVAYEYGFNDMWALEGALYFSSLETDSTPKEKFSGLMNPEIALKGTSSMDWGRLRYGAIAEVGIEKSKTATATRDGNMATGGSSIMPYIGADMDMGGGLLGGRVGYEYMMERTVDNGTAFEQKIKDGHELVLNAFYEHFFADMLIGGSVNYESAGKGKSEAGGIETDVESHTTTGISLYSRMPMGTWALIPRLDYDFSRSHYDKWDNMNVFVTARFGF